MRVVLSEDEILNKMAFGHKKLHVLCPNVIICMAAVHYSETGRIDRPV